MDLREILQYIKEFGILPVFITLIMLYFLKNKERIFESVANHISQFLKNDHQKFVNQLDNDLIIKDIHIIELYLSNQTHPFFSNILNIYDKYKDTMGDKMDEFKKEIISYFKKSLNIEDIESYKIRHDIIQYYQQEIKMKVIDYFLSKLFEAISLNGKSNYNIFKALLRDLLNNIVLNTVDQLEKKFLYSKL
ncbi:MAG: hypothetical protein OEV44_02735 [Spirochaetota bacterium]|nr:hypothetical protein [Spirochaetota bacterium]